MELQHREKFSFQATVVLQKHLFWRLGCFFFHISGRNPPRIRLCCEKLADLPLGFFLSKTLASLHFLCMWSLVCWILMFVFQLIVPEHDWRKGANYIFTLIFVLFSSRGEFYSIVWFHIWEQPPSLSPLYSVMAAVRVLLLQPLSQPHGWVVM